MDKNLNYNQLSKINVLQLYCNLKMVVVKVVFVNYLKLFISYNFL